MNIPEALQSGRYAFLRDPAPPENNALLALLKGYLLLSNVFFPLVILLFCRKNPTVYEYVQGEMFKDNDHRNSLQRYSSSHHQNQCSHYIADIS